MFAAVLFAIALQVAPASQQEPEGCVSGATCRKYYEQKRISPEDIMREAEGAKMQRAEQKEEKRIQRELVARWNTWVRLVNAFGTALLKEGKVDLKLWEKSEKAREEVLKAEGWPFKE